MREAGTGAALSSLGEQLAQPGQRVDEIYARHTGRSVADVHVDLDRDRFFTPEEAMD